MKLLNLTMKCFLSYSNQVIDFSKMEGVIFLLGRVEGDTSKSNGSGKSAIFDAIEWGLFGNSRTNSDDELIKTGEKEAEVSIEFELDSTKYSVYRIKKYGKSQTLSFMDMTNDKSYSGNSVKETQSNIIKVLGLDNELYENTVFARQGRIDEFPRQNPSRRKEMLRDILKIDQYEAWEKQAKELTMTYEMQYSSLKGLADKLQADIEMITATEIEVNRKQMLIEQAQEKSKRIEAEINEKVKEYNQVKASKQLLDKEYDNNSQIKDDIERVNRQMKYIDDNSQKEVDKILEDKQADMEYVANEEKVQSVLNEIIAKLNAEETIRLQYENMKKQSEMLESEMRRILGMSKEYDNEINKLRNKLASFRDLKDKCPLCYSTINDEQKKKVEEEIIAEGKEKKAHQDKLMEEYNSAQDTANKLKVEIKTMNVGLGKTRELEQDKVKYERELINIATTKNKIEYAETKITETKNMFMRQKIELSFELKRKEGDLTKSTKMIEGYKSQLVSVEKMESEISGLDEIRKTYNIEEKKLTEELHKVQYEVETKKKKQEDLEMNQVKLDKAQKDFYIYSELARAFGKNGIPLLVVENALQELQSEVMRQLNVLTDGTIAVEFRTQKELKSGKTADSLDIIVSDREGSRDFNLYSGGEKMRIALAIRLGLSRLLSRRAGKRFDILIVDEISDLDTHGMNKFVDLISVVAKDYKQIFVVSHINELKDRFSQVIQVIKDSKGSHIYA